MRFLITGVLIALLSPVGLSRPYYMSKVELIKKAQVIAILRISSVEAVEVAGSDHVYRQSALATVERVIKGNIAGSVTLYGQQTPEARVDFAPGRYLVFLSRDRDLLVGTNWHLSVRPIKKDKVEWYASNKGHALKTAQLSAVVEEIESIVGKPLGAQKPIVDLQDDVAQKTTEVTHQRLDIGFYRCMSNKRYVVEDENVLQALIRDCQNSGIKLPKIDFSKHTLIAMSVATDRCQRFKLKIIKDDERKRYRHFVTADRPMMCRGLDYVPIWALIPKLPRGYEVIFEDKVEPTERKKPVGA